MNYPKRTISRFELSDRLRELRNRGIETPILDSSNSTPKYITTTKEGVEIYSHEGRLLHVYPGDVIDDHGNVVSIERLEQSSYRIPLKVDKFDKPQIYSLPLEPEKKYENNSSRILPEKKLTEILKFR